MCLGTGLGTWNVRSMYRSVSLTTVARELVRYKLDLVGVQEVRWDKRGTARARDFIYTYIYIFFLMKMKRKTSIWNRFNCTPQKSISS
jgi:exonuclease III